MGVRGLTGPSGSEAVIMLEVFRLFKRDIMGRGCSLFECMGLVLLCCDWMVLGYSGGRWFALYSRDDGQEVRD